MKNIQVFLNEFYQYNKRDFWLIIFSNIGLGIVLSVFEVHFMIQFAVVIIMILKTFSFLRSASIMPSVMSDVDRYSWKYLQGLPLSKKQLLIALVLSNVMVLLPAVVFLVSFLSVLKPWFTDEETLPALSTYAKTFFYSLPGILIISFMTIKNVILFPRRQYSKLDPKIKFLQNTKLLFFVATIAIYSILALYFIRELFHLDYYSYIKPILNFIGDTLKSWWTLPLLISFVVILYYSTISAWQVETRGYARLNWKAKRDIPLMTLCLILLALPVTQINWGLPSMYEDSSILKAVYSKKIKDVDQLLLMENSINSFNQYGVTPLMVAANEGDVKMFHFLIDKGAKTDGVVKFKKDQYPSGANIFLLAVIGDNADIVKYLIGKGFSPNSQNPITKSYAVHIAANGCRTEVLDSPIQHNADLNVRNAKGNTALHIAVRDNCYGAIAMLIDAGADTTIKNKDNKTALENFKTKSGNKEIAYYLEKKFRAPASK